ncbi:MAG: pentapeptide repeat-containing protein, partial [Actinomycetota bacterium]
MWIERKVMEPASVWLGNLAFLEILEYLGKATVLVVLVFWLVTIPERREEEAFEDWQREKQTRHEAWQVINTAQGQRGTGGRIDAIDQLYDARQNLNGITAENANLAGIDLYDADTGEAKLNTANFTSADLSGSDLRHAQLWKAGFRKAYLSKIDLEGAYLELADLREADLSGANLTEADLYDANLDMVTLDNADLQGADLRQASFEEASLLEADLRNAGLDGEWVNFRKAVLQGADLRGTDLSGALLASANIRGADLRDTNLTQAQLEGAIGDDKTRLPDGRERPSWWEEENKPLVVGHLPAGAWSTGLFWPTLAFVVGKGWEVSGEEQDDYLSIARKAGSGVDISFLRVEETYDPQHPNDESDENVYPAPDDLLAWLKRHPHLEIQAEESVKVGGVAGTQLDVFVSSSPHDYPRGCDGPCVRLFPNGDYYFLDYEYRFIILNVGGEEIFISIDSLASDALAEAQEVLNTVAWSNYELSAGEEVFSGLFEPDLAFTAGTRWTVFDQASDWWLVGQEDPAFSTLGFVSVEEVYDAKNPSAGNVSPVPDDLVAWFKRHPHLEIKGEEKVTVGDVRGTRLEV